MPTIPAEEKPRQDTRERIVRAVTAPITERPRGIALLAAAGGAGSLAPDPFGVIVAMLCVVIASDLARKR